MRIAIGKSRKSLSWKTIDIAWEDLAQRLSQTKRTPETLREYKAMPKADQDAIKDVGGFVGGSLVGERRTRTNVESRSLITLDADFACPNMWELATCLVDYEMVCYSTHKHTDAAPRLRFVLPLTREVTIDEYEPISRAIAAELGIDFFDITTHDVGRLFYWASTSADAPFLYERQQGRWVDPDEVLGRYGEDEAWRRAELWAMAESETAIHVKTAKKQGNPTEKAGAVGLFCRTYSVPEAIDAFLSDTYESCEIAFGGYERYTFCGGTTSGGAILYESEDGSFLYSHHATDPICGLLCNAFDLVRLHRFGDLDEDVDLSKLKDVTKLPSFAAMCDLVNKDQGCAIQGHDESRERLVEDFGEAYAYPEEEDRSWTVKLERDKKTGAYVCSIPNIQIILENDATVKGAIAYNEFTGRKVLRRDVPWRSLVGSEYKYGSPWRDTDDAFVRAFLESAYGIVSKDKIRDAIMTTMMRNSYHPVKEYLESLPEWDGVVRAEKVLIDYFGAADSEYARTVTRTWLLAAVARIYIPAVKYDNVLVMVGPQGIGKSTLGEKLGRAWFSDSFNTLQGKEAFEQLRGKWIIEMAELAGVKKFEIETVKHFISKREDTYRPAYGENVVTFPRQCIFYGTSNESAILRDPTGNRRFWTVRVKGYSDIYGGNNTDSGVAVYNSMTEEVVDMIWSEVMHLWRTGDQNSKRLYLPPDMMQELIRQQEDFLEIDPMAGVIEQYLNMPLPKEWDSFNENQRRAFYQGSDFAICKKPDAHSVVRDTVCILEMAYELGFITSLSLSMQESRRYHSILRGIPGWEEGGRAVRGPYGRQRCYTRISSK